MSILPTNSSFDFSFTESRILPADLFLISKVLWGITGFVSTTFCLFCYWLSNKLIKEKVNHSMTFLERLRVKTVHPMVFPYVYLIVGSGALTVVSFLETAARFPGEFSIGWEIATTVLFAFASVFLQFGWTILYNNFIVLNLKTLGKYKLIRRLVILKYCQIVILLICFSTTVSTYFATNSISTRTILASLFGYLISTCNGFNMIVIFLCVQPVVRELEKTLQFRDQAVAVQEDLAGKKIRRVLVMLKNVMAWNAIIFHVLLISCLIVTSSVVLEFSCIILPVFYSYGMINNMLIILIRKKEMKPSSSSKTETLVVMTPEKPSALLTPHSSNNNNDLEQVHHSVALEQEQHQLQHRSEITIPSSAGF